MHSWKRAAICGLLIAAVAQVLTTSEISDELNELDRLHFQDRHMEAYEQAESLLDKPHLSDTEVARLVKRQARAVTGHVELHYHAEKMEDEKARGRLNEAEEYAARAIELDSELGNAYFWKATAIGLGGRIRGVLSSLFRAKPVRDYLERTLKREPDHIEAHFVLATLYDELPGPPLSFGDVERAVSLARRAYNLGRRRLRAISLSPRWISSTSRASSSSRASMLFTSVYEHTSSRISGVMVTSPRYSKKESFVRRRTGLFLSGGANSHQQVGSWWDSGVIRDCEPAIRWTRGKVRTQVSQGACGRKRSAEAVRLETESRAMYSARFSYAASSGHTNTTVNTAS